MLSTSGGTDNAGAGAATMHVRNTCGRSQSLKHGQALEITVLNLGDDIAVKDARNARNTQLQVVSISERVHIALRA